MPDTANRPLKPIPIDAAKHIAEAYGYDQVIIVGRRVGEEPEPHGDHVTTFGRRPDHCSVAARIGHFLKYEIMGWLTDEGSDPVDALATAMWQLLDDMGDDGLSVSPAAKALARIAYEPFADPDPDAQLAFTVERARAAEASHG